MAQEIEPREYQDVPQAELAEELQEHEANETDAEEASEHRIPTALQKILDSKNILDDLSDEEIVAIKSRVTGGYDMDMESMDDYVEKYKKVIDVASMKEEEGSKTFPFQGSSQVKLPQLARAAIDFNSRTVPEIINQKMIANVAVWGKSNPDKDQRAERRKLALNWQLKKGIPRWADLMDRSLLLLPAVGQVFKKICWHDGKIKEYLITADNMVYDHDAESFKDAPRKSHSFNIDWNDFESLVRRGFYKNPEQHEKKDDSLQPQIQEALELVESHCTLDLDGDGYCEPYIVTFCKHCNDVVKIVPRFQEEDVFVDDGEVVEIKGEEFFTQIGFIPSLNKPAVYVGWGDLLYDTYVSLNTMLRQGIDAGTLANTAGNSGFISSNLRAPGRSKSQRVEMILGQLTKMDAGSGQSIKDMIWTPQFTGVNPSFYQMLKDLKDDIDSYTTASQSIDAKSGEAASLYLARLMQALKVPNAITSRVYRFLSDEFNRIDDLMRRYLPNDDYKAIINCTPEITTQVKQQYQQAMQHWQQVAQQAQGRGLPVPPPPKDPQQLADEAVNKDADFAESFEFVTTADPTLGSEQERIYRAEMVATRGEQNSDVYNKYESERKFLLAIGQTDIDTVLPPPTGQPNPMQLAQLRLAQADAAVKEAKAQQTQTTTQIKMVDGHIKQRDADRTDELHAAELENIEADTMQKLNGIDMAQAQTAIQIEELAHRGAETILKDVQVHTKLANDYQTQVASGSQEQPDQSQESTPGMTDPASTQPSQQQLDDGHVLGFHPKVGLVTTGDVRHTAGVHGLTVPKVLEHLDNMQ